MKPKTWRTSSEAVLAPQPYPSHEAQVSRSSGQYSRATPGVGWLGCGDLAGVKLVVDAPDDPGRDPPRERRAPVLAEPGSAVRRAASSTT